MFWDADTNEDEDSLSGSFLDGGVWRRRRVARRRRKRSKK